MSVGADSGAQNNTKNDKYFYTNKPKTMSELFYIY